MRQNKDNLKIEVNYQSQHCTSEALSKLYDILLITAWVNRCQERKGCLLLRK